MNRPMDGRIDPREYGLRGVDGGGAFGAQAAFGVGGHSGGPGRDLRPAGKYRGRLARKRAQVFGAFPEEPVPGNDGKIACDPGNVASIKNIIAGIGHKTEKINEHLREIENL